jgi:hypothetical protein
MIPEIVDLEIPHGIVLVVEGNEPPYQCCNDIEEQHPIDSGSTL